MDSEPSGGAARLRRCRRSLLKPGLGAGVPKPLHTLRQASSAWCGHRGYLRPQVHRRQLLIRNPPRASPLKTIPHGNTGHLSQEPRDHNEGPLAGLGTHRMGEGQRAWPEVDRDELVPSSRRQGHLGGLHGASLADVECSPGRTPIHYPRLSAAAGGFSEHPSLFPARLPPGALLSFAPGILAAGLGTQTLAEGLTAGSPWLP